MFTYCWRSWKLPGVGLVHASSSSQESRQGIHKRLCARWERHAKQKHAHLLLLFLEVQPSSRRHDQRRIADDSQSQHLCSSCGGKLVCGGVCLWTEVSCLAEQLGSSTGKSETALVTLQRYLPIMHQRPALMSDMTHGKDLAV